MARTNDATYAATKAGYAHPVVAGSQLMARPEIRARSAAETTRHLNEHTYNLAVAAADEILTDPRIAPTVRTTMALGVMKLARTQDVEAKEPYEMTHDEMQQTLAELRAREAAIKHTIAERARPIIEGETVNHSPVTPSPFD